MKNVVFSKFSNERKSCFNIRTDILQDENGNRCIVKSPSNHESQKHIDDLLKWNHILEDKFSGTVLAPNKAEKYPTGVCFEFLEGENMEEILDEKIREKDKETAIQIIKKYATKVRKVYGREKFKKSEEFISVFGDVDLPENLMGDHNIDIDLIFQNIIVKDAKWNVIDYEWTFDFSIPVNYVIYRALFYFTFMVTDRKKILGDDIYQKCGISLEEIQAYVEMEKNFQSYVVGENDSLIHIQEKSGKNKISMCDILQDVQAKDLLNKVRIYEDLKNDESDGNACEIYVIPEEDSKRTVDYILKDDAKELRIDVVQKKCIIEILDLYGEDIDDKRIVLPYVTNGICLKKNWWLFEKNYPQITITKIHGMCEKVHMDYYIHDVDSSVMDLLIQEKENKNKQMNELLKNRTIIDKQREKEKEYIDIIADKERHIQNLNAMIVQQKAKLDSVENSISWKITKPVRAMGKVLRSIKPIRYALKGCRLVLRVGVKAAWQQCIDKLRIRKGQILVHADTEITKIERTQEENALVMCDVEELDVCVRKIAVHVHLYYVDLLGEILGYLNNIPYSFDVYISCQENENVSIIEKRVKCLKHVNKVVVKSVPNRGRDIAPLYVWFGEEIAKYDYILHIHSKKSLYTGQERTGWRQYSLSSLLGSEKIIKKIFYLFENGKNVGLVYPDNHEDVPLHAYSWLANEGEGRKFLSRLGIPFESGLFMYPSGSFFWARVDALRPLFDEHLTIEDFQEEAGQTDGTLAHVIERAISFVVKNRGYHSAIIDYQEGVIRNDMSIKAFRPYMDINMDSALYSLMQYDVISFDIFDTLISRGVLHPDDVFELMRCKIKSIYQKDMDFLKIRKQAEAEAWKEKQAYTNINDIYDKMEEITGFSHELILQIRQLELDLEYNLALPRIQMQSIFRKLKEAGKTIILVSDMYLSRCYIENMLNKCGYSGYDEIWISCECGLRKDQDNIWDSLLQKYEGQNFIHVGDNVRSDWQTLIDRKQEALWIMNPIDEWQLSSCYQKLKKYDNGDIVNSLVLGMSINGGLFNSPFALNCEASAEFQDEKTLGFGVFGPMFYKFLQWIEDETPDDAVLAFLAREGYVLEPLYKMIMTLSGQKEKEHCYFLASRRAVTVAGIREWNDVREIVSKFYKGSLSNLLKARFDLDLPDDVEDSEVCVTVDQKESIDAVENVLKLQENTLMKQCAEERKAYLDYVQQLVDEKKWDRITVVDVGYSGTIQYYLAKLLNMKISGYYLATFNDTKPDKIGCVCEGQYNSSTDFIKEINRTQLFLEAVLQAPCGQLIKFRADETQAMPEYKQAEPIKKEIIDLQNAIMDYCKMLAVSLRGIEKSITDTGELVEDIYGGFLNGKTMTKELADIFSVEDDYCSNGVLQFSKEENGWITI